MRYDAAIIGAGAEGLAAAAMLGRAGLRVIVIERASHAGGRLRSHEFHPGFRASPFVDDIAGIPASLFHTLDLARHGAVFVRDRASLAVWPDRRHTLTAEEPGAAAALLAIAAERCAAIGARALDEAKARPAHELFRRRDGESWPAQDWATMTLDNVLATLTPDAAAHVAALAGAGTDPFVEGSALHLLAAGASGWRLRGGAERLATALLAAAEAAGAEFSFGLEASDIRSRDGRVTGVGLADGSEIATTNVISTLDLKRTFLTFFAWNALPKPLVQGVNAFRMAGQTARVLFALSRPLEADGPIHVAPSLPEQSKAHQAWRSGVVADHLPVTLNVVSSRDPDMAPPSSAVVTATLRAIPFRPFDGAWTHEKRELLRRRAQDALESVWPGIGDSVVAAEVVVPPDIEDALGATDGDLTGGEIAGDQMLGLGPWADQALPRTPIKGLYLAGSHLTAGAFATCVAGAAAAEALIADRARGRFA